MISDDPDCCLALMANYQCIDGNLYGVYLMASYECIDVQIMSVLIAFCMECVCI